MLKRCIRRRRMPKCYAKYSLFLLSRDYQVVWATMMGNECFMITIYIYIYIYRHIYTLWCCLFWPSLFWEALNLARDEAGVFKKIMLFVMVWWRAGAFSTFKESCIINFQLFFAIFCFNLYIGNFLKLENSLYTS